MVRRAALGASAALGLAALTVWSLRGGGVTLADRLFWGSAACAAGLTTGWIRHAMSAGRPGWRLVIAVAAVAAGIAWQPMVPALVAVAALTEHVLRPGAVPAAAVVPLAVPPAAAVPLAVPPSAAVPAAAVVPQAVPAAPVLPPAGAAPRAGAAVRQAARTIG